MEILVIGAGIVGMSAAWRLAADGHAMTVIDKQPEPGLGASYANGGQLSYSYVAPLADPSVWGQLPSLLFNPNSPVQFRPGLDLFQYRWLTEFLAACTPRGARRTIDILSDIASRSRRLLHGTQALRTADFSWTRTGKLVVYGQASMAKARELAAYQATRGVERRVLDREGCIAIEPALAPIAHRIAGGLFSPDDEAGDALRLTRELERLLLATPGARVVYGAEVCAMHRAGARITRIVTTAGDFAPDAVVLAAGIGSRKIGRMVGLDLPIYPVKGYTATAPLREEATAPRVSITDATRKVVYARLGNFVRLAGAADLVGEDAAIDTRRAGKLVSDAAHDFPDAADWQHARLWAGLRPATPTGVPLIGRTHLSNLFLDAGHGPLGFTLALGSADLLAEVVRMDRSV